MRPLEPSRAGDPFGRRDGRNRLVLDAEAAAQLNAIKAELRRLGRVSASPPLEFADDAAGRRWAIAPPVRVYAKLSGASSPYDWQEAHRTPGGGSEVLAGGRSGTGTEAAYDANAQAGLDGEFHTLDWTTAGDWRFDAIRNHVGEGPTVACCSDSGGMPETITATFVHEIPEHNFYTHFPTGTMAYGARPDPSLESQWWYSGNLKDFSATTHPDSQMVLTLQCSTGSRLTLGYIYYLRPNIVSPYQWYIIDGGGGPPTSGLLFIVGTYTFPTASNQCSPFLMSAIQWSPKASTIINDTSSDDLYGPVTTPPKMVLS